MDFDGWHKSMAHFPAMCWYSILNPQVLLYDVHDIYFDYRALNILHKNHIQSFILKAGDYVHDQTKDNGPNMKLKNLYGNAKMNWTRDNGTLKFSPPHMNYVLVETWKLSNYHLRITQKYFKKTNIITLSPPDIGTNHQVCLTCTKQSNIEKTDDIRRT